MRLAEQTDLLVFIALSLLGMLATHFLMKRSCLRRGIALHFWFLIAVLGAVGCVIVNRVGENERAHLRRQVEGFAPTYAREIEQLGHARITLKTDPSDPTYLKIIEAQKRFLRSNPAVADIYTFRLMADDKVVVLVDSETDYDHDGQYAGEREQRTPIGEAYVDSGDHLVRAFTGLPGFADEPHTDRWGTWVSAYEPLRDENGNVEGVLGVDYPAQRWVSSIHTMRLYTIGILAIVELVAIIPHVFMIILQVDLRRRKEVEAALRESEERFRALSNNAPVLIWVTDLEGGCSYLNEMWSTATRCSLPDLLGVRWLDHIHPDDRPALLEHITAGSAPVAPFTLEYRLRRSDGEYRWLLCAGSPRLDQGGRFLGYIGSCLDVTDKKLLIDQMAHTQQELESMVRERTQKLLESDRQLMQNEKLAAVGQLAAGIAHEINTPIQYVGDNLRALQDFFRDLSEMIVHYRSVLHVARPGAPLPAELLTATASVEQEHDLEFIQQDAPQAIAQALEGVQRVANIVRAMKDFSHVQREELTAADLNHCIQSTLTVARNEYKYVADVVTDLGELPPVECFVGEINQVLLNMLVNAAHAIADTQRHGTITIRSRLIDADQVEIAISDTGKGIPVAIRGKIFDPFFTTKEVGKGTGQGLNIAHQVIVRQHQGTVTFETEIDKGTTFFIRLPIRAAIDPVQCATEAEHETNLVC